MSAIITRQNLPATFPSRPHGFGSGQDAHGPLACNKPKITIQTSVSKGWLHDQGGFCFDERYYLDPLHRWEQDRAADRFLASRFPDHALHNMESNLVQADHFHPNQILVGGIQPNLILGACLGAGFVFPVDKDSDITGCPLDGVCRAADLPPPASLLNHPLIRRLYAQIEDVRRARPDLRVIPPFFWDSSGRATIHGLITSSLKLYGEDVLLLLHDDPGFVSDLHRWIVDAYLALIRHFSLAGELPVSSVHIGECSGTMLQPQHYEEFIVPGASRLGRELGPVRLHSCGRSDHLLAAMSGIENLRVLDTGSNTSVAAMRDVLGKDFRLDLAPPVEVLLEGTDPAAVLAWLDLTLSENGEGPLHIGFHLEPGYSTENCTAIHDALHAKGLV